MSVGSGRQPGADAFAAALRDAINAKDVTLAWLQAHLTARGNRVSMATLSYWRSGARRPEGPQSMAVLADIEALLDLPPRTLVHRLGSTNRTGPLGPNLFPIERVDIELAVRDVYAALGAPYPDTTRELTTHSVADVGEDGNVGRRRTRSIVQSTTRTITSVPLLEITPGVATPPPVFTAVAGGRVAARHSHEDGEVHGVLFELEAPLTAPHTAVLEWAIAYPPDHPPVRETGHALDRQCRELLLWVRFHPDALPDWCEERVETPTGIALTPITLGRGTSVHRVRRAFGPGAVELRWGYGEPG